MLTDQAIRSKKDIFAIFAVFLVLGPILGAGFFVPAKAVTVLILSEAAEARLFLVGGILLLPVFFLVGLPAGAACGVAAGVETQLRGRPGFLFPLLISTIGALIVHDRAGAELPDLIPLLVCHLGAAAGCTFVAQQLVKGYRPSP